MHTAVIILGNAVWIPRCSDDCIGADRGALIAAKKKIRMKAAIGDFDSVTDEEFALISEWADEVIRLNPIKDDTDSEAAVRFALERGYDHILLCSELSGRADHTVVNLRLIGQMPGILELCDSQNHVSAYQKGVYRISKGDMKYISLFAEEACVTFEQVSYPLYERQLTYRDLYTVSNEIIGKEGILTVHEGTVLVIQSNDIKKTS